MVMADSFLKRERIRKKLTQAAVGRHIGVAASAVCKWEKGRVPAERLIALCDVLGCSASDLRPDLFPADGV